MIRKEDLFVMMGVFLLLSRCILRILLYVNHSMEMKQVFTIVSFIVAMFCTFILYKLKRYDQNVPKEIFQGNIFILLTTDFLVSGLCEIVWRQSEGAWKFFYEKNAVYEYFVYMSKIEIRELHVLLFYVVAFLAIYSIGIKIFRLRWRGT